MIKKILIAIVLNLFLHGHSQVLKKEIPDKLVVLSFDDAPASQYWVVAPMLKEFGFGATFFVCEFPPNYKDSTLYMNWRQIKALDRMGFEVANHTHTHANVSKLTQKEFNTELEYIENKCDSLGIAKPQNFAYPGYGLNAKVLTFLEIKGYHFARAGGRRAYDPLADHPWVDTPPNLFREYLQYLSDHNFKVVSLRDLQKYIDMDEAKKSIVPDLEKPLKN